MNAFKKVVRIGTAQIGDRAASVYFNIEYTEGRLTISGIEGPLPTGNALGGCGQIDMHINEIGVDSYVHNFAPGWDKEKMEKFLDVWKSWHLNDMNAGCEHQRKLGWGSKKLQVVEVRANPWRLIGGHNKTDQKIFKQGVEEIDHKINERIKKGYPITNGMQFSRDTSLFSGCRVYFQAKLHAFRGEVYSPPTGSADATWIGYSSDSKNPIAIISKEESENWVRPRDHPEGKLCKPCPECGYEYGTKWLREEVPEEVLNFLRNLPETDKNPAWV